MSTADKEEVAKLERRIMACFADIQDAAEKAGAQYKLRGSVKIGKHGRIIETGNVPFAGGTDGLKGALK